MTDDVAATEFKLLGPTLAFDDVAGWIEGHGLDLDIVAFVQLTPGGLHAEGGPILEVYEYVKDASGVPTLIDGTDIPVVKRRIRRLRALPQATPPDEAGCNPQVSTNTSDDTAIRCDVHNWQVAIPWSNEDGYARFSQIAEAVEAHRKDPHA